MKEMKKSSKKVEKLEAEASDSEPGERRLSKIMYSSIHTHYAMKLF